MSDSYLCDGEYYELPIVDGKEKSQCCCREICKRYKGHLAVINPLMERPMYIETNVCIYTGKHFFEKVMPEKEEK